MTGDGTAARRKPGIFPKAFWILAAAGGLLLVLMFLGPPVHRSSRSFSEAWGLGHPVAFAVWCRLLMARGEVARLSASRRWVVVLAFCVAAGAGTEGAQWLTGGDASVDDFLRDLVGGVVALAWFDPGGASLPSRRRGVARVLAVLAACAACLSLAAALYDEAAARAAFPVLADFEGPFEKGRMGGNARLSIDGSVARHGQASLRACLGVEPYASVSLVHFPGDWRGRRRLAMEIHNPSPRDLVLTCRIHDRRHEEQGRQDYRDRFNGRFRLRTGWNTIRIDLDEAYRTPSGRVMDAGGIRNVTVFATALPAPRTVRLDHVRLE